MRIRVQPISTRQPRGDSNSNTYGNVKEKRCESYNVSIIKIMVIGIQIIMDAFL
jgi:hypothetical protein